MTVHKRTKSSGDGAARSPSVNQSQKNRSTHWWAGEPRSSIGCHRERGSSAPVRHGIARATRPKTQLSNSSGRPSISCCRGVVDLRNRAKHQIKEASDATEPLATLVWPCRLQVKPCEGGRDHAIISQGSRDRATRATARRGVAIGAARHARAPFPGTAEPERPRSRRRRWR